MTLQPPDPNIELPPNPTAADLVVFSKRLQRFMDFICLQFPIQLGNMATGGKSSWVAPILQNSWQNYEEAGVYAPAGYRKGVDGRVTLRGLVKHPPEVTAFTAPVLVFPVGFRPGKNLIFSGIAYREGIGQGAVRVDVASDGSLVVGDTGKYLYLSINLSFFPD